MVILKASRHNAIEIIYLINECIDDMIEQGIYQHIENYPNLHSINKDISNNSLYILRIQESTVGIITLDEEQTPAYKHIRWVGEDEKVLVIHRLAVFPSWQGKGLGKKLLEFAEQHATIGNYSSIRLDTANNNDRLINIFKCRGYELKGEINYSSNTPFYCFEKILIRKLSSVS